MRSGFGLGFFGWGWGGVDFVWGGVFGFFWAGGLDPFEGAGGFAGDFDVFAFEGLVGAEFPGFDFDFVEGAVGFFGFVAHEEGAVGVFLFDRAFDVVAPFACGGLAEAEEAAMVFADDAVVFEFLDFGHAVALAFDGLADGADFFFVAGFLAAVLVDVEAHGEVDLERFGGGEGDGWEGFAAGEEEEGEEAVHGELGDQ